MINIMKEKRGITLIALIVTIIVLLILAGVTIATLTGDNGLLTKAGESKNTSEKGEIEEQIKLAYNDWKLRKEAGETVDLQNTVQTTLDKMYDNATINKQGKSIIINVKGHEFTLVDDGTMEEGKLAYLDIADGTIKLDKDGYIQGTNSKIPYTGRYIITGTSTENNVILSGKGTFNIKIKNLNIDMSSSNLNASAFSIWAPQFDCFVNIFIEDNNFLQGRNGSGVSFTGAKPNINDVTNGSTLTINGDGNLECKASLGNQPGLFCTSNLIINSGNITAIGKDNGCGIGGALRTEVNNIIINGGNIFAKGGTGAGIGTRSAKADNITINGGNITVYGGAYSPAIGGSSGNVTISGGKIIAIGSSDIWNSYSTIGGGTQEVLITGGTLKMSSNMYAAISCGDGGKIKIAGGNILAKGKEYAFASCTSYGITNIEQNFPTNGTDNLYETQIKLQGIGENKKITNLTTSDNIEYGIKDMYTLEDGMLYLYLPMGTRTITITTEDGKAYSGTVETKETPEEVVLNEIN